MTETVVTIEHPKVTTTTVTATPTSGGNAVGITLNVGYFQTWPGFLKIIQLILGIICMSCASPAWLSGTHFFMFVAVTSFIATLLWTFIYFLGIREVLTLPINWILTELVNTGIATILYTIAFIVQLAVTSGYGYASWIAAGVFGLFNALAYAAGTHFLYQDHLGRQ